MYFKYLIIHKIFFKSFKYEDFPPQFLCFSAWFLGSLFFALYSSGHTSKS